MKKVRESKFSKFLIYYFSIFIVSQFAIPSKSYALTSGPTQPEFNSFTPIGTSDMVDLASGDFNYNIPIMDVGGYPLNLAYNSGTTMDQEASWVGLGWNLNVGQISRQMRGIPDDFNGDPMVYENNMKDNKTYGASVGLQVGLFGAVEAGEKPGKVNAGLNVKYNNYDGIGVSVSGGFSYSMHGISTVGLQMESSASEGVSASPSISFNAKKSTKDQKDYNLGSSLGLSYNSRKGIENFSYSGSISRTNLADGFKGAKGISNSGSISFVNSSFTPTKRVEMKSTNFLFNLNLGAAFYGVAPGTKFSGFGVVQGLSDSEKYSVEKGFGYENTKYATENDILDFNREKDRTVTKFTKSLPLTNYTYDIYNIQAQGISGMFRPYKGQVGFVFDNQKVDKSDAISLGVEVNPGGFFHGGFDATYTRTRSSSGAWVGNNNAINRFANSNQNKPLYEETYFKTIGGNHVDNDFQNFENAGFYTPVQLQLGGSPFGRSLNPQYQNNSRVLANQSPIVRKERLKRNQTIQKLNLKEALSYRVKTQYSDYAKNHHTAEIRITNEDGNRYVFGRALYNITKKEATFDVSGRSNIDFNKGTIRYGAGDNSAGNSRNGDQYFNRVTTPGYAHSYLITNVLSSDFQDLTGDGPTDDDLGNFTKFNYTKNNDIYKWRTPFLANEANYDEGLKSESTDNKANYIYGEKEIVYIQKIETKTHVALFKLSKRKDGCGVRDENGGIDVNNTMYKLDKISLYSKPEYLANINNIENAIPIKEAHFVYNYNLCKGIENNNRKTSLDPNETSNEFGKLTLKKVYFTYQDSKMGQYTPYEFNYQNNYDFSAKAYDVWGNYKPSVGNLNEDPIMPGLSNSEFAYVNQNSGTTAAGERNADLYATAWQLNSIKLPSGGELKVKSEADDYGFVQDKEALEMFKVVGMSKSHDSDGMNSTFDYSGPNNFLKINLGKPVTESEVRSKYFRDNLINKEIYFRFLLNMSDPNPLPGANRDHKYDYVTGYLTLLNNIKVINPSDGIISVEVKTESKGDGISSGDQVSPIAKAGWLFGRTNLNKLVFGSSNESNTNSLRGIVFEILGAIPSVLQLFSSPNSRLKEKGIASTFVAYKSWIRLGSPDGRKIGGGSRVKSIRLVDKWDVMTSNNDNKLYQQEYGQEYSYDLTENNANGLPKSSGVATYEPLGCKENPFNMPFYDKQNKSALLGPEDQNYVELPMGESFYPSPKITYSRVTVKNLGRVNIDEEKVIKKHATGEVISEFFTSKDYPTIVDYTPLIPRYDKSPLDAIIQINAKEQLSLTQGFVIHTNDMDGKMKSQNIYAENKTKISGIEYKYSNKSNPSENSGLLNNSITTIDSKGDVAEKIVGVDYDIINDFRESTTKSITPGIRFNTEGIPIGFILVVVPIPLPTFNQHETKLKSSSTTKVIHSSGILRETIATEDNSQVSTKNLAWDAETGQVLITETVNEYNDKYFSFTNPAYWAYQGMAQASKNTDLNWSITGLDTNFKLNGNFDAKDYLTPGDEVWLKPTSPITVEDEPNVPSKAWVVSTNNGSFKMIDKKGLLIDKDRFISGSFKIIRSGYRNMQMASMASITTMTNPLLKQIAPFALVSNINENGVLFKENSNEWAKYRIVNASAVEYSNVWAGQCECNLPKMRYINGKLTFEYETPIEQGGDIDDKISRSYNPYIYNILGNWKAQKSYAYLTGRRHSLNNPTPRVSGFFNDFNPYYILNNSKKWEVNTAATNQWTFASEVTKNNAYGQEIENKDALDRHSSAFYGYNNRFPTAVASNTTYNELATDNFEDYYFSTCPSKSHFDFKEALIPNKVSISNKQAHTGRNSIRVEPSNKAVIIKKIPTCATNPATGLKTTKEY